ncbi:MAG: response regulator [Anaerolineaceae bacterium]|nr:response regulator [Anaerolineaceae bacterium]
MSSQQNSSARALVVDDSADNRNIFELMLQMAGYAVTSAANGREGLEKMAVQSFHLMILDLDMPILNGRDVLLTLQTRPDHRPKHIIVATANPQMTTETVLELSDFVVIKPINVKELVTLSKRLNPNTAVP